MTIPQFRYINTETETAYIDSRVYCADIIEVDHAPWVRDTLRKYQTLIEQYFGVVEFKTQQPPQGSAGGRPEVFALLTESQCNFALTLSRNTPKTMIRKAELIAEFEAAKKVQKRLLERQLAASLNPTPPRAIVANPDNTKYNITFWKVHADSGIVDPWYVRDVIVQNYDFKMVNGYVCVTQKMYQQLLLVVFRSQRGAKTSEMPPETLDCFVKPVKKCKNTRSPQQQ